MLKRASRMPRKLFIELSFRSKFVNSKHFTLRFRGELGLPCPKLGVSVSKKVSKKAVVRNTIRRRVYSSIQGQVDNLRPNLYLIVAKPGSDKISGQALEQELFGLFNDSLQIVSPLKTSYNS